MILQALKEYYDRKAANPDSGIAPLGWEWKEIPFVICLDNDGKVINVEDTREEGDAKKFLVPKSLPRSGKNSYKTTFVLWDHIGYVLGFPKNDIKSPLQHDIWKKEIEKITTDVPNNNCLKSIKLFYERDDYAETLKSDLFKPCLATKPAPNVMFRVGTKLVVEEQDIQDYVNRIPAGPENVPPKICLVCGQPGEIVRIHSDTRIGKDAKKLVGFQKNSGYDSYGKEQAYNAPVCDRSMFAYTTALNTLLAKDSKQKLRVGDATTVFWSAKQDEFEDVFGGFFEEPPKDDPDRLTNAVAALYQSPQMGAAVFDADGTRFYVLGLSPNVARIAVRFWHVGTVSQFATRFREYFEDLRIAHGPKEQKHLSLWRLLVSTAVQGKSENIAPNLAGNVMRAILEGLPFPETLLQAAIVRVKAEREVNHARAKLIKGCLNRKFKANPQAKRRSLTVSLDKENTDIGYRLGRLFAVLEKIQQEANPGINATIRDKFYASASSTPVAVFHNLMRLKNHHLPKLKSSGRRIYFERLLAEIISEIPAVLAFPAHLNLVKQGKFAIGYYHQVQDFYTKKTASESDVQAKL